MWFKIKHQPEIEHGAKHIHETIVRVISLTTRVQDIVKPVIQRNGYFCHPENILIAMICDERSHIRELGWRRVLKARSSNQKQIRTFKVPPIKYSSEDYIDLIDWDALKTLTEAPLTKRLSESQIKSFMESKALWDDIPKIPSHTQSVERHIKLVTQATEKVCGPENRDGFIRATLASRNKIPVFENKQQFKF